MYGFNELVGEAGGYIGMLLGVSIMDLALTVCELIGQKIEDLRVKKP